MGELILCSQKMAALPYYVEEVSLNVYSLEELSYYIENNVYLLTENFMSEELCAWIETELGLTQAAAELRGICRSGMLFAFVEGILNLSGYLGREQIRRLILVLKDMENKSEFERMKMKADRYVENRRYISAISEYHMLLEKKDESNEILLGNIWHNLGRAYAGVFFFKEAAECFAHGYELNGNPETMRECLYAYRCMRDEAGYKEAAQRYGVKAEELMDISRTLTAASRTENIRGFEQQLEELFLKNKEQEIGAIVTEWKETYRKNCRI